MPLFSPFAGLTLGLKTYIAGVRWLRAHPRYFVMLILPIVVGLVFLVGGITLLAAYDEIVAEMATADGRTVLPVCALLAVGTR